jgi:G patch domain-containing protein 1
MGMYGPLTREKKPWQPAKLLCKRFGVKEPNPEPEVSKEPMAGPNTSAPPSFAHPDQEYGHPVAGTSKDEAAPSQQIDRPRDLANIGLGEDETQGQDTLTYERPSMDIFKAIFASDSEDSDDEAPFADDSDDDAAASAQPKETTGFTPATVILDDTPVDLSTFKPTFIPREGKSKKSRDEEKSKAKKEKKEKKEKKKKEKKAVLVSFELDEDGAEAEVKQPKDRPKKKRKEDKIDNDDEDQGMWAAKHPAEPAKTTSVVPPPTIPSDQAEAAPQVTGPKGRKRAIDFM